MRVLIFGDIHMRTDLVDKVVSREKSDRVLLLGDYFDSGGGEASEDLAPYSRVAGWLAERVVRPDWRVLLGNHEVPYRWYGDVNLGHISTHWFDSSRARAVNSILGDLWDHFLLYWRCEDWFFSHAGLSADFLDSHGDPSTWDERTLGESITNNRGLVWGRFPDFQPVAGLNQVFGHTHISEPTWVLGEDSVNFNLDSGLSHFGIWEDGSFEIRRLDSAGEIVKSFLPLGKRCGACSRWAYGRCMESLPLWRALPGRHWQPSVSAMSKTCGHFLQRDPLEVESLVEV